MFTRTEVFWIIVGLGLATVLAIAGIIVYFAREDDRISAPGAAGLPASPAAVPSRAYFALTQPRQQDDDTEITALQLERARNPRLYMDSAAYLQYIDNDARLWESMITDRYQWIRFAPTWQSWLEAERAAA